MGSYASQLLPVLNDPGSQYDVRPNKLVLFLRGQFASVLPIQIVVCIGGRCYFRNSDNSAILQPDNPDHPDQFQANRALASHIYLK